MPPIIMQVFAAAGDTASANPSKNTQAYTGAVAAKSSAITTSGCEWYATCDASLLIGTAAPPTGSRCPTSGTLASGASVFYKRAGTSQPQGSVGNVYVRNAAGTLLCTIPVAFT